MSKILIVRLGALGDLIHAVPAAAALKRAYPDTRVDWLVDVRHRELLDLVPVIDNRIAVDTKSPLRLAAAIRMLRRARYDVALDLQGLIKSAAIARASGAVRTIGFPRSSLREPFASLFYTETAGVEAAHVIRKNVSILKAVGIEMAGIEFPIESRRPEMVAAVRHRLGIGEGDRFAVLNPGGAWPNKQWPPVYFGEVAAALSKRYSMRSIVTWGPGEQHLADAVVAASHESAALSPQTTVTDLVSIAKAASLMVSGDTGPIHIACATGTPVVGIYGPTSPERNGPWASHDLTVSRYGQCECHYQRQCHAKRWCLLEIAPRDVIELVDDRLAAERS